MLPSKLCVHKSDHFFQFPESAVGGLTEILNILKLSISGLASILSAVNLIGILNHLGSRRQQRLSHIREALELAKGNNKLERHFEDELEGEYFRLIHRVRMEKSIRDAVIDCHTKSGGSISFIHFLRSRPHLSVNNLDKSLSVKISTGAHILYYANLVLGFAIFVLGAFLLLSAPLFGTLSEVFISSLVYMGCLLLSLFFISETRSVNSARLIKKFLQTMGSSDR